VVNVSAIVASAFIGAVATGIITLLVRELRGVLNTRRKRERFRDSLIGEIEAGTYNVGSAEIVTEVGGGMMPTSVFDGGTEKLGLLTENEIQSVTTYYARAQKINALSNRIALNPEEAVDPDSKRETQLARAYYSEREYTIEKGDEAVEKLREHKGEIGLRAYLAELFD
jgi:hypothetical protein